MEDLVVPGTMDALEPIREYVASAAKCAGLGSSPAYKLCLAVDEIATNAVMHGYLEAGLEGDLRVRASVDPDKLIIRLEDHGKPYDPSLHQAPDEEDLSRPLEERPIGGLGILLARDSVDELDYTSTPEGNAHIFIVRLPAKQGEHRNDPSNGR